MKNNKRSHKNMKIDCVHDNGKKYFGMNTFIRVMTM